MTNLKKSALAGIAFLMLIACSGARQQSKPSTPPTASNKDCDEAGCPKDFFCDSKANHGTGKCLPIPEWLKPGSTTPPPAEIPPLRPADGVDSDE